MMNCFIAFNSRVFTEILAGHRKPGAGSFCDRSLWGANTRQWLLRLALVLLGWSTVQEAKAVNYTFQGSDVPASCSGSKGSYTCETLTLRAGDTITTSSPVTVNVTGAFEAAASSVINFPGTPSNLTFKVDGTTNILNDAKVNANVTGKGVITLGDRVTFTGNIVTTDAVINVGNNSILFGNLTTGSGAINVGAQSKVDGSINAKVAGVVTIGAESTVTGDITTKSGAINIGTKGVVGSSISSTLAGVVTIGAQAIVTGNINTASGAINLGAESKVGGSISIFTTGAITVSAKTTVGGGVSTKSGAITLGEGVTVDGSVCTIVANAGGLACSSNSFKLKSRDWRQIFMR